MICRALALSATFIFVSCGRDSQEKSTKVSAEDAFVGTWTSACVDLGAGGSMKTTQVYKSDKSMSSEIINYTDSICANKSIQQSFFFSFSVVGDGEQSSKAVEFTLVSVKLSYYGDVSVGSANAFKSCGTDAWQSGITVDCTNKPINSSSNAELDAAYRKGFKTTSNLKIDGSKLIDIASPNTVFTKN